MSCLRISETTSGHELHWLGNPHTICGGFTGKIIKQTVFVQQTQLLSEQ